MKKPSSLPKLTDLINGEKEEKKEEAAIEAPIEPQGEKKNEPIDTSRLKEVWEEYKEIEKKKNNNLAVVTLNKEIKLLNETEVHLALASHIEIDGLNKIKVDLVNYLRTHLNNDFIDIIADVKEEEVQKKAYTNSDKFEVMMEKQPALKELRDRLGLDPDI